MFELHHIRSALSLPNAEINAILWQQCKNEYKKQEEQISAGGALVLWLADVLNTTRAVRNANERALMLSFLGDDIIKAGTNLLDSAVRKTDFVGSDVLIVDREFTTMTGMSQILHIPTGNLSPTLSVPPIEKIYYSLTTIFVRNYNAYNEPAREDQPTRE